MKKTFNLQKTIISLLFSGLILLPLISCKFNTKQQITENEDIASDTVSDTVSVGFNIALPDEYKINPSRSAIPKFSDNTLRYDVIAAYTENGTTKQITREGFASVPFYLPLIPEKTYTITVKAYARTDASKSTLFTGSVKNITVSSIITEENGPFTVPLMIYKDENGNITSGSLNLQFIVDYASSQGYVYKYRLSGNGITPITNGNGTGGLSRNTPFNINITDIPANSNPYDFVVTFKAGTNIVYQFYTDVMIFAGAETNTWKNEQELGSGENSNTVVITQALVNAYTSKYFYIKNDSTIEAGGQGTYEAPWRSLQSAFDKINEINDGISTYRVYILDDLTGSYVLNTNGVESTHYPGKVEFELPSSNTKDLHLLIQGIGSTKPTLNSASTAPEISVTNASNKTVTLELRNIDCAHEIEVENVDITLTNINTNQTSSTALIEVSDGDAVLTNVKAGDITVTNGRATLEDVQAATSISVSGGNATFTNINQTSTSSTYTPTITTSGGTASLTDVNAGNITIGGTANGTSELTNVNTGNITVSNGNATLENVQAAAIEVTYGNATMTTVTATGDVTVGGNAELDSVTASGDIEITATANLTNVNVSGDITVTNGNVIFDGINENATSSSTVITTTGASAQFTTVKAASLTSSVSTGNASLSGVTSNTIVVTIPSTNTNGKASLNAVHADTSISVSGGAARLYNVTSPSIDFTDVDITLIGVTSTPAPATGNNITLDENCTIKIGGIPGTTGTTAHPNTIGKINLPKNTSDTQIKFEILNQDTDNSVLTLNNSTIGFVMESEPNASTSFIQFTDGLAQASNTSDLPNTIFTNLDDYNIGVITPSGQTGYEAGITISSGNINTSFADNITFQIDKSEIERKAHNATDTGSFTIPSTYTANPRTITVTAKNGDDDLPASSFTTLSLRLVTSTNTVLASNSSNGATITVPYGQTEGNYTLRVFGLYDDGANTVGYSSDFTISVVDNVEFMPTKTILVKDGTTAEKTLSVSGTYNSNNLTIGSLNSTTEPFTITSNANGSASVVLSAASPECGSNAVNVYGHYTTSDNETVYFRDVIPITIVEFIVEFKKNTTVQTGTIYIDPDDTGNNRKIKINANLHISDSTADDISLNSTAEVHVVRVTGSGANENEEELYIYDDVTPASNEIVYTVPAELPIGFYRIYITFEYEGVTKTIIRNLNISSAGFPVILGGTFNSSTTLSDSSVFIANRNLTIPQLIASDHEVTQGEYEQYMTYYGVATNMDPSKKPTSTFGLGSDYPAYFVNWYEAIIYCNLKSIADNLTPVYYLVDSSGVEMGGTGNGRNPSSWVNTIVSGTNIAVSNGKYYYNSTSQSSVLDYIGNTDANGGIRFDQNANGWRLPTDAEWEYLARSGNLTSSGQQDYSGTNIETELTDYAWYGDNSGTNGGNYNNGGKNHEVKTKQPNSLNLYDMSGNTWEWCWDWYSSPNSSTPEDGPSSDPVHSNSERMFRGGSWQNNTSFCKVSYRNSNIPSSRARYIGFRVVRTLSE